jgi:DNA repair protein RadC
MSSCSLRTRPVTKALRMADQLPLFQEGNTPKNALPVYRVTLVREGQLPSYNQQISCSADASRMLSTYLADVDREHFVVLMLDQKNHVIGLHTVSMGSLTTSIVHPREVFKAAILANAATIICGHNHPSSGDARPSQEDRAITHRLADAGKLLGINVVDHIIIGSAGRYFSFADEGLLGAR